MAADEDFEAWFRLLETPCLGRAAARRLLQACGSPQAVLAAGPATWTRLAGSAVADALRAPPPQHAERLGAVRRWLEGGSEHHALTLASPEWPPLLLQTADPPLLLYVRGEPKRLAMPSVAVVGSRQPTPRGIDNARAFAAALGAAGYAVVSGLAQGIDAAAHEGALAGPCGTLAVMGTGPDLVYPARHRALAERIAAHGALVSEFAPGTPPLPAHFAQRNRIIAGLALGTLVVEAAPRSGSLITARLAREAGREVFAIPGSIHAAQSRGCHALIRQGAKLVETASELLEELRPDGQRPATRPGPAPEAACDPLVQALGEEPVTLDVLLARTGCPTAELRARLLALELEGAVTRLPGGLYQRRHAA